MRKVSVIIPVYKVEEYLDRCIESVVSQKYKNLEIILVDDGSPDNCPKMCDKWAKKDSRIKVIHKENGGLSSARNAGFKIATASIITFIDSDDYLTADFSVALKHLPDDFDVICCPMIVELNGKRKICEVSLKFGEVGSYWKFCRLLTNGRVMSRFYKADAIRDIPFDETMRYGEDTPFTFNVWLKCDKVFLLNIPWYVYNRNNPTSLTRTANLYKVTLITLEVIKKVISLYESTYIENKERRLFLKRAISEYVFSIFYNSLFLSKEQNEVVFLELRKLKKYIIYGSNFKYNLAIAALKIIGFKNTVRLIHIYKKMRRRGKGS